MTLTLPMPATKRIALVAHDHCKPTLLAWAQRHRERLSAHRLHATGTTGHLLQRHLELPVQCLLSGPRRRAPLSEHPRRSSTLGGPLGIFACKMFLERQWVLYKNAS